MTSHRIRTSLLGALTLVGATILSSLWLRTASAAPLSDDAQQFQSWFNQMDAYYASHPELTQAEEGDREAGNGWEPYSHLKWFWTPRLQDGELPAPGARWHASEVRRERMSRATPRANWFSLGPANFAGRMLAIDFDPTNSSIVYVGAASGGVWKSTDSGTSWTPISDDLPSLAVGGIAVAPFNSNIVVIGAGEATANIDRVGGVGILRSTDAGATWNTTNVTYLVSQGHGYNFVKANPLTGTMLAGTTDGMWRSSDDGATWTRILTGTDWYDVCWRPGDANVGYAVRGDNPTFAGVKKTTDDGLTWADAGTGQPAASVIGKSKLAVSAAQPDWVYVLYGQRSSPYGTIGLYRSTDAGATWTARNTSTNVAGGQSWYNLSLAADPNNGDTVIAGGVNLYRSVNGGTTLAVVGGSVHVDHHAAGYASGSSSEVWVGSDGGIWRSTDDGANWTDRNAGLVTYQFYDICVNNNNSTPYYVMGGTQDQGTDKWSGTTTWQNGLGADGMVCNIDPVIGTTVYAEIQSGDHRRNTTSGIGGYTPINSGLSGSGDWVAPVDERQDVGTTLFTATSAGVFRTTDSGSSWQQVTFGAGVTWISVSWADPNIVWTNGLSYSTDGGTTWQGASVYPFATGSWRRTMAHPTAAHSALSVFGGYAAVSHVAFTTDLGATWTDVTGDLPPQPVNAAVINPSNPSQWFIGTDTGVWLSDNGGVHWTPFQSGLPNVVVDDLEIQVALQKLVAGTHGRGAWEIDIPQGGTGVDLGVAPAARNLMLDAPFPNPVKDRTLLRFAAKSTARASLAVYDVQGRLVTSLADFSSGDGIIRTTPWFATDVPNGVYFAVLKAGAESVSRKIVVAR
ncbi:MAG: T9SS type A sorting domain-containing protein [bacterium]